MVFTKTRGEIKSMRVNYSVLIDIFVCIISNNIYILSVYLWIFNFLLWVIMMFYEETFL